MFFCTTSSAFAGTLRIPTINGEIHDFNNMGAENISFRLEFECFARRFSFGSPMVSCGKDSIQAKVEVSDDGKVTYKFNKTKFKYRVRIFNIFDSISIKLYTGNPDSYIPEYSAINLSQFATDKKVDWSGLSHFIKEVSLYGIKANKMSLSMPDGDSATQYLKSLYAKKNTLYMGIRYQLLNTENDELNRYDAHSYSLHEEGEYYANRSIDDDAILSERLWLFPGVVDTIKLKFTSFVTLKINNGVHPTPKSKLRHVEKVSVYPDSSLGANYPFELTTVTVDESWERD